jgi:hypothetical protein
MFYAVLSTVAAACNLGTLLLTTVGKSGDAVVAVLSAVAMVAFGTAAIMHWRWYARSYVEYEMAHRSEQKEEYAYGKGACLQKESY